MKFVVLISLALFTGCAYLPYIAEETLEIIEEVAEIEEHRHMAVRWWEEDTEEGEALRKIFFEQIKENPHCLRLRKHKWPWGIC